MLTITIPMPLPIEDTSTMIIKLLVLKMLLFTIFLSSSVKWKPDFNYLIGVNTRAKQAI